MTLKMFSAKGHFIFNQPHPFSFVTNPKKLESNCKYDGECIKNLINEKNSDK